MGNLSEDCNLNRKKKQRELDIILLIRVLLPAISDIDS